MLRALFVALALLSTGAAHADYQSGSASKSCSGHIDGEYFYAYTYQYVYFQGRKIVQENHNFNLTGPFSGERFQLRNLSGPHVIYESARYFLAVPWQDGASIQYRPKFREDHIRGPEEGRSRRGGWQTLCR